MAHLMKRAPGEGASPVSVEETEIARFTVTADVAALDRAFGVTQGRIPATRPGASITLVKRVSHYHGGGFVRDWVLGGSRAGTRKEALGWAALIAEPA